MANEYIYCPFCGSPLQKKFQGEIERLICTDGHVVYRNSKPAVGAVIIDNSGSKVLLTKRAVDPFKGEWDIPGGFLENGEHPEKGIRREIKEELGIDIEIYDLLGHFIDRYGEGGEYTLNIFYIVKAETSQASAQDDILEWQWFDLDQLPDKLSFAINIEALSLLRKKLLTK